MKQTIAMKQAAFEELMREHGFQYLGATTYDGSFIYQRTWHRTAEVAFYGLMESTFLTIAPHIEFQSLEFDILLVRNVIEQKCGEVGLPG